MHFNHVRNSMNKYNKKHERSAFAAAAACCLDIKTSDSARVNDETIRRFFFALNVYRKLSLINQRLWGGERKVLRIPNKKHQQGIVSDAFCFVKMPSLRPLSARFHLRWKLCIRNRFSQLRFSFQSHPNDFIQYLVIFQKYAFVPYFTSF